MYIMHAYDDDEVRKGKIDENFSSLNVSYVY